MAIVLPILSEFKDKGIKDANKAFKDLEGFGAKAAYGLKKAFVPATAALAGLAAVGFQAVNAALDDAAAQEVLRKALQRTTKATHDQLDANNDFIDSLMLASNVADDELRPALSNLAAATGNLQDAQKLLALAVDIAAATGKPLESVSSALAKAFNGQYTALGKLDPTLRDVVKAGGDADEVFGQLNKKFGGAAAAQVGTTAGQIDNMKLRMDELKESIGAILVPFVEGMLPYLQKFADWAEKNPELFTIIAATIGTLAAAIVAVNVAMALNPFVLAAAGIAAVVAGIVVAYNKFETFRNIVNAIVDAFKAIASWVADNWQLVISIVLGPLGLLISNFRAVRDVAVGIFEIIADAAGKLLGPLEKVVGAVGKVIDVGGKIGGAIGGAVGGVVGKIPFLADGGIVKARNGGTLALIGEGGRDEAVVPLGRGKSAFPTGGINITVNGAVDPVSVARQIQQLLNNENIRFGY